MPRASQGISPAIYVEGALGYPPPLFFLYFRLCIALEGITSLGGLTEGEKRRRGEEEK